MDQHTCTFKVHTKGVAQSMEKPAASKATVEDPGEISITNPRALKGNQNTIGARSKTLDLSKSSQTKSFKVSTSGNLLNRLTTKNKVPSSSPIFTSKQSPNGSKSSEIFKPSTIKNEAADSNISEKNRTPEARSLIPVKKTQEKREQKRKSVKLESLKPNTILSATSTKSDTKANVRNLKKDSDAKVGTTLSNERDLEVLLNSPLVKSSAHSGIIFMPKKKSSPGKSIFILPKDGSSNDDQSSNSLHQPSIENQPPKPARKTLQYPNKDATNETAEKTISGKHMAALTKKTAIARTDKATSSKLLRSKTEVTISTNPRPSKPLHKVQSFSRLKPQPLIAKKPAHQAILDVTALVKGDPKVAPPPLTSAHSGVPFKPKKPSTFAAVNIFAQLRDSKDEF